jgi:hypothetical protein
MKGLSKNDVVLVKVSPWKKALVAGTGVALAVALMPTSAFAAGWDIDCTQIGRGTNKASTATSQTTQQTQESKVEPASAESGSQKPDTDCWETEDGGNAATAPAMEDGKQTTETDGVDLTTTEPELVEGTDGGNGKGEESKGEGTVEPAQPEVGSESSETPDPCPEGHEPDGPLTSEKDNGGGFEPESVVEPEQVTEPKPDQTTEPKPEQGSESESAQGTEQPSAGAGSESGGIMEQAIDVAAELEVSDADLEDADEDGESADGVEGDVESTELEGEVESDDVELEGEVESAVSQSASDGVANTTTAADNSNSVDKTSTMSSTDSTLAQTGDIPLGFVLAGIGAVAAFILALGVKIKKHAKPEENAG